MAGGLCTRYAPQMEDQDDGEDRACYGASNADFSTAFDTLTLAAGASYAMAQETIRNTVAEYNWCPHDCSVMLAASLRPASYVSNSQAAEKLSYQLSGAPSRISSEALLTIDWPEKI